MRHVSVWSDRKCALLQCILNIKLIKLTLIITVRDVVITNSCSVRITSILSVLVPSVFIVKSNVLLCSDRAFHSLTLGRVFSLEIKRAY